MKKTGKKSSKKTGDKKSKKQRKAEERAAKKEARKGDGSFPDILVVTKEKSEGGKPYFLGHKEDLASLYTDGETVAVYKLRRVSTVKVTRKVVR
jgi:hypothetical protein